MFSKKCVIRIEIFEQFFTKYLNKVWEFLLLKTFAHRNRWHLFCQLWGSGVMVVLVVVLVPVVVEPSSLESLLVVGPRGLRGWVGRGGPEVVVVFVFPVVSVPVGLLALYGRSLLNVLNVFFETAFSTYLVNETFNGCLSLNRGSSTTTVTAVDYKLFCPRR